MYYVQSVVCRSQLEQHHKSAEIHILEMLANIYKTEQFGSYYHSVTRQGKCSQSSAQEANAWNARNSHSVPDQQYAPSVALHVTL
jgi:hypothetical protein